MQKSRFLREEQHIDVDLRRFRLADQRWTPGDLLAAPNCRVSRLRPLSRQEFRRRSAGHPNPIRSPDMPLGRVSPVAPRGPFSGSAIGRRAFPPARVVGIAYDVASVEYARHPSQPADQAGCQMPDREWHSSVQRLLGGRGNRANLVPTVWRGPSGSLLHPDPRKAAVSARRPLAPRTARAERSPATIRLRRSDRPRGRLLHQRA